MFSSPLSTRIVLICLTCTLSWSSFTRADEYLGAEAILKQAREPLEIIAPSEDSLRSRMTAYQPEKLSPDKAAQEWLALLDEQWAQRFSRQRDPALGRDLFQLLPPPSTWEALKAAIDSRPPVQDQDVALREVFLRVMGELLTENFDGALQEVHKAKEKFAPQFRRYGGGTPFDWLEEQLIIKSDDPNLILPFLEQQIEKKGRQESFFTIPDLVPLIGREKTAAFLKKAYTQVTQPLHLSGKETTDIARKVALANVNALKFAPWQLAASLDGAALFEALDKKFPDARNEGERQSAEGYYFLSLIADGKMDHAEKLLSSLQNPDHGLIPRNGIESLERQGKSGDLFEFSDKALAKNPNLPLWDSYISLAIKTGETNRALERVNKAIAGSNLNKRNREAIQWQLPEILLALDQVEEGISALQTVLKAPASLTPENRYEVLSSRAQSLKKLTELGLLLQRQPLVDEGLSALKATLASARENSIDLYYRTSDLPELLFKAGRGADAEKALIPALKSKQDSASTLMDLCALYSVAGRDADLITLLQEAPGWETGDLLSLLNQSSSSFSKDRSSLPMGYIAAKAFFNTGKPEKAGEILRQFIKRDPGYDPAYELLLKLKGAAAMEDLDRMIARDRFQERPLIWKAQLLFDAGKLEEAEKTVRQAIAIDPSDGEEGPDDRMRAYLVLAKIREARGDKKEAGLYQNVIKAIRLSEEADRYASAGLLTRAAAMYQEALNYFSDAYCVQSRLAKNLWELGRYEEAERHYQKAYELMPESFGRVESHCFGCEKAFAGEKQQAMAEKIFSKLAKETPTKPQAHYLLGYLFEEQEKETKALASYREAVKLDPDYLNAWKKIVGLKVRMPAEERENAILQALRLDPLGRHGGRSNLGKIKSPKKLWEAVTQAAKAEDPAPESLYVLKASHENLEKQKQENRHEILPNDYKELIFSPASAVSEQLSPIVRYLEN